MNRNIPAQDKRSTRKNLEINSARDNGSVQELLGSVCRNKRQYVMVYKHSDLLFSDYEQLTFRSCVHTATGLNVRTKIHI
jgi:hypothetical protein